MIKIQKEQHQYVDQYIKYPSCKCGYKENSGKFASVNASSFGKNILTSFCNSWESETAYFMCCFQCGAPISNTDSSLLN